MNMSEENKRYYFNFSFFKIDPKWRWMADLAKEEFLSRYLNEGFSGGEKKRAEVLQMAVLKPKISILDEPDSGLDIDAVQSVAKAISQVSDKDSTTIVITHYARILNFLDKLDHVHVFADGRVLKSGDASLAQELEKRGYDWVLEEVGIQK